MFVKELLNLDLKNLNWKIHGMGVATHIIWKNNNEDLRLHWWSPRFKNPAISKLSGAIHWHSFDMRSWILKGQVKNTIIDFDNCFGSKDYKETITRTISGPEVYYAWNYKNSKPSLVGEGFVNITDIKEYNENESFYMEAGIFHYYETISEEAFTLVYRIHKPNMENIVLTNSPTGEAIPPINGRLSWLT